MKVSLMLSFLIGVCILSGCVQPAPKGKSLPYCFMEETPENPLPKIGHIEPIPETNVLLFPIVTQGVINGKKVAYGLGSPVVYKQGDDLETLHFRGVERWPTVRFMVWARGHYMREIPRQFLYSDIIAGKKCLLVELTPLMPGTDRRKLEESWIRELKSGKIIVEKTGRSTYIADVKDYSRLIKAPQLVSWKVSNGFQNEFNVWGLPGATVDILLSDDDFKLIESYLKGDQSNTDQNQVRQP